jgi:hypothetical protein
LEAILITTIDAKTRPIPKTFHMPILSEKNNTPVAAATITSLEARTGTIDTLIGLDSAFI